MRHPGRSDGSNRVTLADVAVAAGVSTASVSRALARPDRVSAALAARVKAVASALRYVPNAAARSLSSLHSREVAVLVGDLPHYASPVDAAIGRLLQAGWAVSIARFDREPGPGSALQAALERDVEGVLLLGGAPSGQAASALAERRVPWVALCAQGAEADIAIDLAPAMRALAHHLRSLGHRRATCLIDSRGNGAGWPGAAAALGAGGIEVSFSCLADVSAEPVRRWPTAIVCADDLSALEAVRAGELRGIAIPEAVSVIGCGNQPFSALTSPPLTTVDIPWRAAGEAAAASLLAWHEQRQAQAVTLTAKLVVRRSCGPARSFT